MKENLFRGGCELPHNFKTQNKSMFQLFKESGYFEQRNSIKTELVEF